MVVRIVCRGRKSSNNHSAADRPADVWTFSRLLTSGHGASTFHETLNGIQQRVQNSRLGSKASDTRYFSLRSL